MEDETTSGGTPTPSDNQAIEQEQANWKRALASPRPGEPPLDELTNEDQSWLVNALSTLQKIYEKRETGPDAFCIFALENSQAAVRPYVQFLAQWDANELVCEAVSAKSVPEIAAILGPEEDAALKNLGFKAPEKFNYWQLIPIAGVADLAYAARLLYRTLKHVYKIANIIDVKHRINLPRPSLAIPGLRQVRKLYEIALASGLGSAVHFEDLVNRFSLTDLEYLLEGGDRLKFTYLYSDGQGLPRGEELRRWVQAGITGMQAREAQEAGYTFDTLQEAIKLGMLIDGSVTRDEWLRRILQTRWPSVEYLQACLAVGLNGEWVQQGLAEQVPVEVLQGLQAVGVPARYVRSAAYAANLDGTVHYEDVWRWYLGGVYSETAMVFMEARVDAETAIAWLRAGFLPSEAIQRIQSGISLESAKAERAKVPFSKAFRRDGQIYSIRGEFKDRIAKAVAVLDVPSFTRSSMFSSLERRDAFLDGGYLQHSGYGWGSHSYTIIVGNNAGLLICHRIGVQPPRQRREAPPSRSAEELEAMLRDQRLNRWNDLVAKASKQSSAVLRRTANRPIFRRMPFPQWVFCERV